MDTIFRPSWAYLPAIGAAVGGWFGTIVGGGRCVSRESIVRRYGGGSEMLSFFLGLSRAKLLFVAAMMILIVALIDWLSN
jgi:hypothetical protein